MARKDLIKEENGVRYFSDGNYVDLSNISKTKTGKVRWSQSIGKTVRGKYCDKLFEILITDYNKDTHIVYFTYENKEYEMSSYLIADCRFGSAVNKIREYKYKVGEVVDNLEIVSQIKVLRKDKKCKDGTCYVKGYIVKCLKDNYEFEVDEGYLTRGRRCPVCSNHRCVKGINDIATTHPHLVKYFLNVEDAYTHKAFSNQKVIMKCPNCGFEKKTLVSLLTELNHFSCKRCGDGVSYPNKFVTNFVMQLDLKIELEKCFSWSQNKKYDIYLPEYNCIIENHGQQHYEKSFGRCFDDARTLEEEKENDKLKKELALSNGIKYYIELDCRKSELEWIKNSIMNSELPQLLNFKKDDINWIECEKYCFTSLMIKACKLWDKEKISTNEIAKRLYLSPQTIIKYLKTGTNINICNYSIKENKIRTKKVVNRNGRVCKI